MESASCRRCTTIGLAAGLGVVAGMRSMTAPAVVGNVLFRGPEKPLPKMVRRFASRRTAVVLAGLAAGEAAADKTDVVPDRTAPPSLAWRALVGAACGAAVAHRRGESVAAAGAAGAAAAVASSWLFMNLRREAGLRTGIPDPLLGLVEDSLAVAAGFALGAAVDR